MKKAKVLYISYDGLLEPLGQSQVWQYLYRLASDHKIHLLSYEKHEDFSDKNKMRLMKEACVKVGINWHPKVYHKKPIALATIYDVLTGLFLSLYLVLFHRISIVHTRSYVPSIIGLALKRVTRINFVFDMRGFWADEQIDGGNWNKESRLYHLAKWFEKKFLTSADVIVSLSNAATEEMRTFDYLQDKKLNFKVIPTCADLEIFSLNNPKKSNLNFTMGYVGSIGSCYLFEETLMVFKNIQKILPNARLLILNKGSHKEILTILKTLQIPEKSVELTTSTHNQMPSFIQKMDASVYFIKPMYSKKASAATKLAELLGCGVPVLVNSGIGDQTEIVSNEGAPVGIVINDFATETLIEATKNLIQLTQDSSISSRCRKVAEKNFSVEWGVKEYSEIYKNLTVKK